MKMIFSLCIILLEINQQFVIAPSSYHACVVGIKDSWGWV
jgi:hypothetical protein